MIFIFNNPQIILLNLVKIWELAGKTLFHYYNSSILFDFYLNSRCHGDCQNRITKLRSCQTLGKKPTWRELMQISFIFLFLIFLEGSQVKNVNQLQRELFYQGMYFFIIVFWVCIITLGVQKNLHINQMW